MCYTVYSTFDESNGLLACNFILISTFNLKPSLVELDKTHKTKPVTSKSFDSGLGFNLAKMIKRLFFLQNVNNSSRLLLSMPQLAV